jgi:hypothetical protein
VWHKRVRFFLAVGLHQFVIAHDHARFPVGDNTSLVYQNGTVTYLQDKFQIMSGD